MSETSLQSAIIELLNNSTIIKTDVPYLSRDIINIIENHLLGEGISEISDLNTVIYNILHDAIKSPSSRLTRTVKYREIIPPIYPNKYGYNIEYTFSKKIK